MEINKKITVEIPFFPEEIIEAILAWLPVKSLLKFKSVSKSWRTLISTTRFITSHLKNSSSIENLERHGIITSNDNLNNPIQFYSHLSLLHECPMDHAVDFDYPIMGRIHRNVRVVGSCNGLVCLLIDNKSFVLWNPSTRKSRKLPNVFDPGMDVVKYGFGYDKCKDDYKVFGVLCHESHSVIHHIHQQVTRLYSLKRNSWKIIGNYKRCVPDYISEISVALDDSGTFVDGKLYWGRGPFRELHECNIDFFDLENETYGKIEYPLKIYDKRGLHTTLGVLEGCLSLLCNFYGFRGDVWILKPEESWSKLIMISFDSYGFFRNKLHTPVCMHTNDEIIVYIHSSFVVYSLKDRSRRPRNIGDLPYGIKDLNPYIESLVSV